MKSSIHPRAAPALTRLIALISASCPSAVLSSRASVRADMKRQPRDSCFKGRVGYLFYIFSYFSGNSLSIQTAVNKSKAQALKRKKKSVISGSHGVVKIPSSHFIQPE